MQLVKLASFVLLKTKAGVKVYLNVAKMVRKKVSE